MFFGWRNFGFFSADPSLVPSERFRQLLKVQADVLLLGDSAVNRAGPDTFVAQAGATLGNATPNYNASALATTAYKFGAATSDAFDAPDAAVGDATGRVLVFQAFRSAAVPAALQSLHGKRGGDAGNAGYELQITAAGHAVAFADTGPAFASLELDDNLANNFSHVIGYKAIPAYTSLPAGLLELTTETEPAKSAALVAGSLASTGVLAVGQQRILAADALTSLFAVVTSFPDDFDVHAACKALALELFWSLKTVWNPG